MKIDEYASKNKKYRPSDISYRQSLHLLTVLNWNNWFTAIDPCAMYKRTKILVVMKS
jgi:hypothetical protein